MPTLKEIKNVVWACGTSKASGYDGFNFKAFREVWEEITSKVYSFIGKFFRTRRILKIINLTWVTLIPKVQNPISIEEFRHISMIGALY